MYREAVAWWCVLLLWAAFVALLWWLG